MTKHWNEKPLIGAKCVFSFLSSFLSGFARFNWIVDTYSKCRIQVSAEALLNMLWFLTKRNADIIAHVMEANRPFYFN